MRIGLFLGVIGAVAATFYPGIVWAQSGEISGLREGIDEKRALLREETEEISAVREEIEDVQVRLDVSRGRAGELGGEARELRAQLALLEKEVEASRALYEEQARAAYRGENVDGALSVLRSLVGANDRGSGALSLRAAGVLLRSRENLEEYEDSRQLLRNTVRQLEQKRGEYRKALKEEWGLAKELRRREKELDASVSRLGFDVTRMERRIQEIRARRKAFSAPEEPATGWGGVSRRQELKIAREEIVARAVEPISDREYERLYRESAALYGFGEDWYVLAAVGKVESNHGENMGPSAAGAMGPMQFLPSTWKDYGVDGNGDGAANIMDPRDAIPAAARYLKAGGAPDDWYAALYSYNRAGWYVKEVLLVAEGYRKLDGAGSGGSYLLD